MICYCGNTTKRKAKYCSYRCRSLCPEYQQKRRQNLLLKTGMTWENHGSGEGKWQIDHVRPVCSFPEGTPANVINALENLQPLWTKENLEKGAKYEDARESDSEDD